MSVKSIAQSERINIRLETKQEIALTLKTYPLVLNELYLTELALDKCNDIRVIQESELQNKDEQINTLKLNLDNLDNQNELLKNQLRRQRIKPFIYGAIGVAVLLLN